MNIETHHRQSDAEPVHITREAEAYLSARADAAEAARARLCPCGIALRACQCPLRQAL